MGGLTGENCTSQAGYDRGTVVDNICDKTVLRGGASQFFKNLKTERLNDYICSQELVLD